MLIISRNWKLFDYKGKVAVITGGLSGIGVLFSHALPARGCDIVLLARRKEKLEENAENIRNRYGVKCLPLSCDVTDSRILCLRAVSGRAGVV